MDATENDHRSRKGIRAGYIIRCTVELVVLTFVGLSIFNYFIFDIPDYADEENGIVNQNDFENAHDRNVLHYPHWSAMNPVMLVEPDCPYVKNIAGELYSEYEWRTLKHILLWISSNITYESDETLYGVKEYWALPCETLHYMRGDCEDFAILFCSIALACGLDVCMLNYEVHITAGVYQDGTLFFCDLYSGYISRDLEWEGERPKIVDMDHSTLNLLSQAFAWSNKWLHKGTDWMLT